MARQFVAKESYLFLKEVTFRGLQLQACFHNAIEDQPYCFQMFVKCLTENDDII